jgi:uncharacterized membrane protein YkvA (DUF1232 family)
MKENENYDDFETLDSAPSYKSQDEYERDVDFIEENLWTKLERVGKKISFTRDIVALYKYLIDPEITWYRKSIIVFALIYFISPIDTIPDIAPLFGYMDDLGVMTALLKYLGSEIIPYYDK